MSRIGPRRGERIERRVQRWTEIRRVTWAWEDRDLYIKRWANIAEVARMFHVPLRLLGDFVPSRHQLRRTKKGATA